MAQIIASTMKITPYTGDAGNLSGDHGSAVLNAAQIADTIDLLSIPAGAKLRNVNLINAALGALTTVSLGWRYKDGTAGGSAAALLAATSTAAAAKTAGTFAPIVFTKDAVLYATVGGAAASGQIDAVTEYVFQGTL
ncbi:MAG: hypothetical protein K2X64_12060 [Rhodocyclaceae bacterium]|jgi:hypothetical protein|nr:hypothetical protein [Rhodocyclaceae bacterium]